MLRVNKSTSMVRIELRGEKLWGLGEVVTIYLVVAPSCGVVIVVKGGRGKNK